MFFVLCLKAFRVVLCLKTSVYLFYKHFGSRSCSDTEPPFIVASLMLLLCLLFIMAVEDSWAYYLDCEITDIEIAAESHVILQKAMSAASKAQAAEEAFEKAMPAASKAQAAEEASGARGSSTVETAEEHWRQQRSQWSLPKAKAWWSYHCEVFGANTELTYQSGASKQV